MIIPGIFSMSLALSAHFPTSAPVVRTRHQKQDPKKFFSLADLTVPRSAAQTLLGLDASKAKSFTSFTEFSTGLFRSFDDQGFLQEGISLSSPLRVLSGNPYFRSDLVASDLSYRLSKMSQVSFATSASQEKGGPAYMAWGTAFPIYDRTHWFAYSAERVRFSKEFAVQSDVLPVDTGEVEALETATGWQSGLTVGGFRNKLTDVRKRLEELPGKLADYKASHKDANAALVASIGLMARQGIEALDRMKEVVKGETDATLMSKEILDPAKWTEVATLVNGGSDDEGKEIEGIRGYLGDLTSEPPDKQQERMKKFDAAARARYWNREKVDLAVGQTFYSKDKSAKAFQSTGLHAWLGASMPLGKDAQLSGLVGRSFDERKFDDKSKALTAATNGWTYGGRLAYGTDAQSFYVEYAGSELSVAGKSTRTAGWKIGAEYKLAETNWLQVYYDSTKATDGSNKGLLGLNFVHNFATSRSLDFKK